MKRALLTVIDEIDVLTGAGFFFYLCTLLSTANINYI
jgi:hypothetical protein